MKKLLCTISFILFFVILTGSISAKEKLTPDSFEDFDQNQYWAEPMTWAITKGLIKGFPSGELKPNLEVTEKQFLTILFRYFFPDGYTDLQDSYHNISTEIEYNVAKNFNLSIRSLDDLNTPISRGAIGSILAEIESGNKIAEREAVAWMYQTNVSSGYPDEFGNVPKTFDSFGYNNTLTRAHAVTFIYNYHVSSKTNKRITKITGNVADKAKGLNGMEKLQYLYKDKKEFLKLILSYENEFSNESYNGNKSLSSPVKVNKGSGSIIISAPHSTKHIREGQTKDADVYTGALALFLQDLTNSNVIFTTKIADDANYIEGGIYKETLNKLAQDTNSKYVIDLHGAASSRNFDIDLGTIDGKSMDEQISKKISNIFSANYINNVKQNDTFSGLSSGTIVNYSYNYLGLPSVQMEINRKYRNPREDIESFYLLLKALVEVVEMLEGSK